MTDRINMVDSSDDSLKHGQKLLGPLKGTEEKGQQVLPAGDAPRPGQDSDKLVLPPMPLPPELPAD
ncbi:hypothetical protein GCM10009789_82840 [Kribbella sancticallisti]|uniref:Uncharacterized protein n=1 Tax=Kribbella sancticallisti TaxID=460087 RepID=A0ABN2ESG0_9ACTN